MYPTTVTPEIAFENAIEMSYFGEVEGEVGYGDDGEYDAYAGNWMFMGFETEEGVAFKHRITREYIYLPII